MGTLRSVRAVVLAALVGCGGEVVRSEPDTAAEVPPVANDARPPPVTNGPWGTWQILSVDGDDRPPNLEVELREDGRAFSWGCPGEPDGLRCTTRIGCNIGTIAAVGAAWHARFTTDDGDRVIGEGEVVDDSSGDVWIDGSGVLPRRARYRRVGAPGVWECFR